jgi:hypothetical protein
VIVGRGGNAQGAGIGDSDPGVEIMNHSGGAAMTASCREAAMKKRPWLLYATAVNSGSGPDSAVAVAATLSDADRTVVQ